MPPLLDPTSNEQKYDKLKSAVIIGATTAKNTRIWVRVYQEGNFSLLVTKDPLAGDLVRLEEKPVHKFLADNSISVVYLESYYFTQNTNLTHVFDIHNLEAYTRYFYAVISNEMNEKIVPRRTEMGADNPLWFRTMPSFPTEFSFGFYSCHDHISSNGNYGAWPHFLAELKDCCAHFVIGGGDQIYVDTNSNKGFPDIWEWLKNNKKELLQKFSTGNSKYDEASIRLYLLNIYRWYYRVYWNLSALREVYERFPQYMMWDDHEIMDGWGSLTNEERLKKISLWFEDKDTANNKLLVDLMWEAACQAYYEYEHSHNPKTSIDLKRPDVCHWDYSFRHGNASFYMLDMRGHHDIEKNKDKDRYIILGQEQFSRFNDWLAQESTGIVKTLFIISPVPVIHWKDQLVNYADLGEAKDDFMDEWGHESNRWERNKLLEAIFKCLNKTGKTCVILSGDVHCASIFRLHHNSFPEVKVFQITSSAITRKPAPKASILGISSGGKMDGNDDISFERLFALVGNKNFSLIHKRLDETYTQEQIIVDLYWPSGEEDEVTMKRVFLR